MIGRLFPTKTWKVLVAFTIAMLTFWAVQFLLVADYALNAFSTFDSAAFRIIDQLVNESYLPGIAALFLIVLILLAALMDRIYLALLADRFRSISGAMQRFAAGDTYSRANAGRTDEIGALAATFNTVADTVVSQMQALREADRKRKDLVSNIAHDLKTPLTSVQGYLETVRLKDANLSSAERLEFVNVALKHTANLMQLLERLLELARLDNQSEQPQTKVFEIGTLIEEVIDQFTAQAKERSISIELMGAAPELRAKGDPGLLHRALTNIVQNAIAYNRTGGKVVIKLEPSSEAIRIFVIDTGIGIAEKDLPHVCERFYRVNKERSSANLEAGLGLSITQAIVEAHASNLKITSQEGVGTQLEFSLPRN